MKKKISDSMLQYILEDGQTKPIRADWGAIMARDIQEFEKENVRLQIFIDNLIDCGNRLAQYCDCQEEIDEWVRINKERDENEDILWRKKSN